MKRLLDNHALKRFEHVGGVKTGLEREVGEDLALMLDAAKGVDGEDQRQRIVIRPYPLRRAGTLTDQLADVSGYETQIAGCLDLVSALRRMGQITAEEQDRYISYLNLHELPWPHSPAIKDNAILYLDGLAVSYLQHLRLLDRLRSAGFTAFVSVAELADGDALVNHEAFAEFAQSILEDIRSIVAENVISGKIIFGKMSVEPDGDNSMKNHPSTLFFDLATLADALIVDDRALNSLQAIDTPNGKTPIFNTLDLLNTLTMQGAITESELGEFHTKLRRSGMIFIPVTDQQLGRWLNEAVVSQGMLIETAELRAI